VDEERSSQLWWWGIGAGAPVAVAAVLVAFRDVVLTANLALVMVLVVVVVAAAGGRTAGAIAAVMAAVSFDFFLTKPYLQLTIASDDDIETTFLLLVVGLVVGTIAATARRARVSAQASSSEVRRIHHLADLSARGEEPAEVIRAAQSELVELLGLRGCRFEAPPFSTSLDRLERTGTLATHHFRATSAGFELPRDGAELPVLGRGQLLGRFVLDPTPGVGVTLEQRVVAVALADQVGAVLAAPERREESTNG
jgi:hypothetical protein